jgi:mono/diheme cytochrome c family protein
MNRCFLPFVIALALSPTFAVRAASDVDGKDVYAKNCQSCHGADGHGETPAGKALKAVSLIDPKWATPEAIPAIEKAIREGGPRMPAMKAKLTPEEIAAVARYAQQLASGKP